MFVLLLVNLFVLAVAAFLQRAPKRSGCVPQLRGTILNILLASIMIHDRFIGMHISNMEWKSNTAKRSGGVELLSRELVVVSYPTRELVCWCWIAIMMSASSEYKLARVFETSPPCIKRAGVFPLTSIRHCCTPPTTVEFGIIVPESGCG